MPKKEEKQKEEKKTRKRIFNLELPSAPIKNILKDKCEAKRISPEGVEEIKKLAEAYIIKIGNIAVSLAKHRKKITVQKEDIETAVKNYIN